MATTLRSSLIIIFPLMCVILAAASLPVDFPVCSCVLATVLAGLFGGLIRLARLQGMDSKTMMAKILDEVRAFCGDRPRSDDMTLTIIRTE